MFVLLLVIDTEGLLRGDNKGKQNYKEIIKCKVNRSKAVRKGAGIDAPTFSFFHPHQFFSGQEERSGNNDSIKECRSI